MLRDSDPDSHDSRVPVLDSINGGVPYPGAIYPRETCPARIGMQACPQGALPFFVPFQQLAVGHVPVRGRSAAKQAERVNLSTDVFNVLLRLKSKGMEKGKLSVSYAMV